MSLKLFNGTNIAKSLQDNDLIAVENAGIEVKDELGVLASLFEDEDGSTPQINPFTADDTGNFSFYARSGTYNLIVSKGATTTTIKISLINESFLLNVKDFGAVGDGVTDDTAAIQLAMDYAGTAITDRAIPLNFPTGDYVITQQINIPLWVLCRGGQSGLGARFLWNGVDDGGIAFSAASGTFGGFQYFRFEGPVNKQPTTWLSIETLVDQTYVFDHVQINRCRGDAVILEDGWINLHWSNIRWDHVEGYAIAAILPSNRSATSFKISEFTYDHSIDNSTCEGMIHIDNIENSTNVGIISLSTGRMEVNREWVGRQSIFTYLLPDNPGGARGTLFVIDEVTFIGDAAMLDSSSLYRETINDTARESLRILNCRLNLIHYISGTWPDNQTFPEVQLTADLILNCGVKQFFGSREIIAAANEADTIREIFVKKEEFPRLRQNATGALFLGNGTEEPTESDVPSLSQSNTWTNSNFFQSITSSGMFPDDPDVSNIGSGISNRWNIIYCHQLNCLSILRADDIRSVTTNVSNIGDAGAFRFGGVFAVSANFNGDVSAGTFTEGGTLLSSKYVLKTVYDAKILQLEGRLDELENP